jgi:hypothetical protein
LRRCAYLLCSACLFIDALGSFLWGSIGNLVSFRVGTASLVLGNLITSCVASQALMAFHFVFVSFRSRNGRAWAYASLKFQLDQHAAMSLSEMSSPDSGNRNGRATHSTNVPTSRSESDPNDLLDENSKKSSVCNRLRRRYRQLQKRHLSRCKVFVIPCAPRHDANGASRPGFEIARPLFNFRWLQPLHRLTEAYPKFYLGCIFAFVGVSSFVFSIVLSTPQERGIATLICNSATLTLFLGFCSSPSYNLDRVASKHVASSFRFVNCAVLLFVFMALEARKAYIGHASPWQTAAIAILCFIFCLCSLIDSSPHFPTVAQTMISVQTHIQTHTYRHTRTHTHAK